MERWDELRETLAERVERRQQLAEANKHLNTTAQLHGLERHSFGRLHDAGTRGLYGGRSVAELKTLKAIAPKEEFADHMGLEELAANLFVRTQTEAKVRNEQIQGTDAIVEAHHEVGAETRTVIKRIGGTRPEELPPEPSIRSLLDQQARQRKKQLPQQAGPSLFDALPPPTDDETQR